MTDRTASDADALIATVETPKEVIQLPASHIYPRPDARKLDQERVDQIAESIREVGLINPLHVRRHKMFRSGTMTEVWRIIAGHHRYSAAVKAKLDTVPCIIIEDVDVASELVAPCASGSAGDRLGQIAGRIRSAHRNTVEAIIEIGIALNEAKRLVGHGQFVKWIRAEFAWSDSSANRFMAVAQHFADKSVTVKGLDIGSIYSLAARSTPAAIRNEIVQRLEAGERVDRDLVRNRISDAKRADAKAKEDALRTPQARKARAAREARHEADVQRWRQDWAERDRRESEAGARAADFLLRRLDAEAIGQFELLLRQANLSVFRERLCAGTAQEPSETVKGARS